MAGGKPDGLAIYKHDWGLRGSSLREVRVAGDLFCRTRDYWEQIHAVHGQGGTWTRDLRITSPAL